MELTKEEKKELHRLLKPYINSDPARSMKDYIQHGRISTRIHSYSVTCASFWISRRLKLKVDEQALVTGAFLHDLFLYDWHGRSLRYCNHGFTHPEFARANAVKHYNVGKKEQNIIRSHMWPMTLFHMPLCREAWIVTMADKYVSLRETLFQR